MDQTGVEACVVFTDAIGGDFDRQEELFRPYGERFLLFCSLDTSDPSARDYSRRAVRELERCHRQGARGLGEISDKGWGLESGLAAMRSGAPEAALPRSQRLHPDDPRLDAVWEKCAGLGMAVNIHVADHPSCWYPPGPNQERMPVFDFFNMYGLDVPPYAELLGMRDRAVAKHPRTIFIAAHLGNQGNDLSSLGQALDRYPNLYIDISARDYELGRQPRFAREFLTKYRDRVLYGSDMPCSEDMYRDWWRLLETADEFLSGRVGWPHYGLELPDSVLKSLYRENAKRLLRIGP